MRKYYLDHIRWGTILLVVVYHIFYMYNGVATAGVIGPFRTPQYQDAVQYLLYPWFMILLFLVSGMCARYYLDSHTIREFLRSRTQKLLVPSTLGLLVFGWIQGYINMSISDAFSTMPDTMPGFVLYLIMALSGTGVLWFIQLLWLFSLLLALVRRFEKGKLYALTEKVNLPVAAALVVLVYLSGLVLNMPIVSVYRFGIYGVCFFLGYFVFAHDEVIDRISRFSVPLIVVAIVLGIAYPVLHFGENYAVMPTVGTPIAVLYAWATCLAILGAMKKWCDKPTRIGDFFTKHSFGIYVLHYLPLSTTAYLLHRYTALTALPSYLLTALAAFAGTLLLYEVLSRIPVLRYFIFGIKKSKKKQPLQEDNKDVQG